MSELKTLKELPGECTKGCDSECCPRDCVKYEVLREEAKKWVKEISDYSCTKEAEGQRQYFYGQIDALKRFFNLEGEE